MIFISRPTEYSDYGTYLPPCDATPFNITTSAMNVGGIGISASTNRAVRVTGVRLNGTDYFFPQPVEFINRDVYNIAGVYPNASERVGKAMRDLYYNTFNLSNIPFLFTVGWNPTGSENYTAHVIDNDPINGFNNNTSFMIYQFKMNNGVWGTNIINTYNTLSTGAISINSDVDPFMRCAIKNLKEVQLKSLYTATPDIILEGLSNTPSNLNVKLTYLEHLSLDYIDQLLYPLLKKTPTNCTISKIGNVNLRPSTKTALQTKGYTFLF